MSEVGELERLCKEQAELYVQFTLALSALRQIAEKPRDARTIALYAIELIEKNGPALFSRRHLAVVEREGVRYILDADGSITKQKMGPPAAPTKRRRRGR